MPKLNDGQIRARRLLVIGSIGIGIIEGFALLWHWKARQGKAKKKRA